MAAAGAAAGLRRREEVLQSLRRTEQMSSGAGVHQQVLISARPMDLRTWCTVGEDGLLASETRPLYWPLAEAL